MDEATFRILDTLSREIGNTLSIHQLTAEIREYYGTGYYARTYNKLQELSRQGLVTITKAGRSCIPSLNFSSYPLLDLLSEIEIRKKREFLNKSSSLQPLIMDIEAYARRYSNIQSISLISPEHNAKLNRTELLILMRDHKESSLKQIASIYSTMRDAQSKHNVRTEALLLSNEDFAEMLASDEINPLKQMLHNKITFHAPQAFWTQIADAFASGHSIRLTSTETNPAKIAESDLIFNLNRFGYRELGHIITEREKICIEYIIASILMNREARRIDAIPVLLSKNKANYSLLIFLSHKYGLSGRLLGLLKALNKIRPTKETAAAIEILEAIETKEIKVDKKSIEQKMRLYNAIR